MKNKATREDYLQLADHCHCRQVRHLHMKNKATREDGSTPRQSLSLYAGETFALLSPNPFLFAV